MSVVDDLALGDVADVLVEGEWLRLANMRKDPHGGGWGRRIDADGHLDNSRDGIVNLDGQEPAKNIEKALTAKDSKKSAYDPVRDGGVSELFREKRKKPTKSRSTKK